MNCVNHPEASAVAFCRTCGKALCEACRQPSQGTVFCAEHVPTLPLPEAAPAVASPWSSAAPPVTAPSASVSPGLAFILGWIPGVGAIYNGQYAKGLVHVVVIGLLISIMDSGVGSLEPLVGLMIALWFFYMAFEAYHTAKKRQMGLAVDEFSSLFPARGCGNTRVPIAPLVLIVVGVVFLLHNLEVIRIDQILKFWPVIPILLGIYMLYVRFTGSTCQPAPPAAVANTTEVSHEQQ